jgi:hypothetical protein
MTCRALTKSPDGMDPALILRTLYADVLTESVPVCGELLIFKQNQHFATDRFRRARPLRSTRSLPSDYETPMARSHIILFTIGVVVLPHASPLNCFGDPFKVECNGKYKGGLEPSDAELKKILQLHAAWVKDGGPSHLDDPKVANDPRRANLCGANLSGPDLSSTDLGNLCTSVSALI